MRVAVAVSLLVMTFASRTAPAQVVGSFSQLPLRINRDDQVRVVDQSGAKVTGRVVSFGRDGLVLRTDAGERRFTAETSRKVYVSGSSKARGALIGAGTMLVVGLVGCPKDSASGCPVFAALLWGAPLGTLIGAWVPSMHAVYRADANRPSNAAPGAGGGRASLLNDLGMRVNLGDKVTLEMVSGETATGTLTTLYDDGLTLCGDTNCQPTGAFAAYTGGPAATRYRREEIRRVTVTHKPTRKATLIGFLTGAVACLPAAGSDWVDAIVLCGGMGAGVGALVGAGIHHTTVVYPATEARVSFSPTLMRDRVGMRVSYRF